MTLARHPRALLFFGLFVSLALAGAFFAALQAKPASAQEDPFIARGKYLVAAGGCAECHTQRVAGDPLKLDQTKLLGGGEKYELGPVGTIHSRNISSHPQTGIGSWTISEIVRALDEGLSKDGTQLVLMPWQEFRGMATTDKVAIAIYLKSSTGVNNTVPPAQLTIPRAAMYGQAAGMARPIGAGSPPDASDVLATGEYLVWNALGCSGCHGQNLKGGTPPFNAADISPTGKLRQWTEADIIKVLREGKRPDGSSLNPIMPWGERAYGNLTDSDARAVARYLKTVTVDQVSAQGVVPPAPPPAPEGGDISLNPLWLAAAGALLLIAGFGVMRLRVRRPVR